MKMNTLKNVVYGSSYEDRKLKDKQLKDTCNNIESIHLVVVGFDDIVTNRYLPCFEEAINMSRIDSYSIVELENKKDEINRRLQSVQLKPKNIFYLSNPKSKGAWADPRDFVPIFNILLEQEGKIKVYIATEVKAHESYLKYCIENGIDSLVEKPVITPMKNNRFDPLAIEPRIQSLVKKAEEKPARHSVMTLTRYHKIYNDEVLEPLKKMMLELAAPLTSFHISIAGGVWNMHREYEAREDHPYKYGYGMLMHSGYHYVDLLTQFLSLNRLIFPNNTLTLTLSSFVAYPSDQNDRIPKGFSESFDDNRPDWALLPLNSAEVRGNRYNNRILFKE